MAKTKILYLLLPVILLACAPDPRSGRGFRLPDGDAEAGKAVFAELECTACHSVAGTEFVAAETKRPVEVQLGGKVLQVRSYGQLVTAVVHPSHDIAKGYPKEKVSVEDQSMMGNYNSAMTVQQLIDLVAFLQSTYEEYLPQDYDPYFP